MVAGIEVLTKWESNALGLVGILLAAAIPLQVIAEVIYWLRFGEWFGTDIATLLGTQLRHEITSTGWAGVDFVVAQVLSIWIALPMALAGLGFLKLSEL